MRPAQQPMLLAASQFYTPLLALFAFMLLATRSAGGGVGLLAGLAFGVVLCLHVLAFGAGAARKAAPPLAARGLVALGLLAVVIGAGAPRLTMAAQVLEAGLFLITAAGVSLLLNVLAARAPTLRDDGAA